MSRQVELNLAPVNGVRLGTIAANIKYPDRPDLVLMELAEGASTAAVFTQNAFCAAPVQIAKANLAQVQPRYLLVNTGYANAGTGAEGLVNAQAVCAQTAELAGVSAEQVLPFSTGVIGEPLPVERINAGLPAVLAALSDDGWAAAASGIMTTDTCPKGFSRQIETAAGPITITGICKGSGMIMPNMATMLAFVATDAQIAQPQLQAMLSAANAQSFNCVTVDGDTSTNDACMLVATNKGVALSDDASQQAFQHALNGLLLDMAHSLIRDGEGATKFVAIEVTSAASVDEARQVAYTVAHSPLVKTALFAADPNWGRILAAVGRAGVVGLDVNAIRVHLDDVLICAEGGRHPDYTEAAGQAVMNQTELSVRIDLARGPQQATVWTCDFSYDYVKINAEYRS